jgi:sulfotransferase
MFYFVSGLPRSGSTLLCNILAQNPKFHTTHTSGCLDILFGTRNAWDKLIEHQAHPDKNALLRVQKAIIEAYYADVEKPVVIDKSRGWTAYVEFIEEVLSRPIKILVPVRPIADVLASMEKLHRETSKVKQPPGEAENYFQMQTVAGRCEYWCDGRNVVGLAANRIKDCVQRGYRDRLHFVDFNKLTTRPEDTLSDIYAFLDEEPFKHNFNNVEQVTHEDDSLHGYVGLHTIKSKVEWVPSQAIKILGKDLANNYSKFDLEY